MKRKWPTSIFDVLDKLVSRLSIDRAKKMYAFLAPPPPPESPLVKKRRTSTRDLFAKQNAKVLCSIVGGGIIQPLLMKYLLHA